MEVTIRPAKLEEAQQLSGIACLSKAHWGYAAEQIDYWRTQFLKVKADYISAQSVWVAVDDRDVAIRFAALEQHDEGAVLEHLGCCRRISARALAADCFAMWRLE